MFIEMELGDFTL